MTRYANAIKAKQTKVWVKDDGIYGLKYGIKYKDTITFNHLLSLCLYTDFNDLCTDFSESFRSLSNYESLNSIKQRNRNYRFMSKYLRECVELFGDYRSIWANKQFVGPFYTGSSFVATFSYTDISVCAPTLTSSEKSVATRDLQEMQANGT